MTVLRQFLYRDDPLIREFLAQIEGGVFDEDTQTNKRGAGSTQGGKVRAAALEAGAEKAKEESQEIARVVRQTGASEFQRLYAALEDQSSLQFLDNIDEDIWAQLRRGEILELEVMLRPAGLGKVAQMFEVFEQMLPVAEATGAISGDEIDHEARNVIDLIKGLSGVGSDETLPLIASLASAPRFQFGCLLRRQSLLVDPDLREGEVTLVGKLQRKLRQDERHYVAQVFGGLETVMAKEDQDEFLGIFEKPEVRVLGLVPPVIEHPGAVITPIAVYR